MTNKVIEKSEKITTKTWAVFRIALLLSPVALLLSLTPAAQASALSTLAASMQPGTWAVLNTNGFNSGAVLANPNVSSDYITQYTEKAVWDVTSNKFLFLGAAHGNICYAEFVIYSDANNTWTTGPMIPGYPGYGSSGCSNGQPGAVPSIAHAYDHNAVDQAGNLYFRPYNTTEVWKYNVAGNTWSKLPNIPMGAYQIAGALEWFPDRNELIFIDGDWGVWRWQPSTNQWTEIATTTGGGNPALPKLPMRSYQNFSRYSPAAHAIWFGGTTPIYKYDASGNFTTLKPAPFNLGIQSSVISVDPVSGKYLILPEMGAGVTQFWQYDLSTDTWLQLPNTVPTALYSGPSPFGVGDGLIVAPISTYGVLMYVKYNFGQSAIYLYKHAPSTPPTTSPCDVNGDGVTNVADVQLEVNMALGINPCTNASGTCTVVSVQRVVNAALGGQCVAP